MLLSDAPEVAVEAAGALRNFILSDPEEEGKETVADEVYRKDGMTPLLALVPKFVTFFTEKPYLKKDSMNADGADADGDEGMGKKMSRKERKALKAANAGEQQPEQSNGQSSEQPAAEKKKEKKDDVKAVIELAEQVLGVLSVLW